MDFLKKEMGRLAATATREIIVYKNIIKAPPNIYIVTTLGTSILILFRGWSLLGGSELATHNI